MIGIGVIGIGYWGPNILKTVEMIDGADIIAVCERDPARLSAYAARYPAASAYDAIDSFLDDPNIDAVIVATPTETHFDVAGRALAAGKHVLVEKPITTRSEDARTLGNMAAAGNRILMVGHVFVFNEGLKVLKDHITSGELGTIHYMNMERTNLGPIRTDVDVTWDLMAHDISVFAHLMDADPVAVSASGAAFLNVGCNDIAFATFKFATGAVAHVHTSWLNPRKVRQLTVVGADKMAIWDDTNLDAPLCIYDKRVEMPEPTELAGTFMEHKTVCFDGGLKEPVVPQTAPLQTQIEHFIACVRDGGRPTTDWTRGHAVVCGLEAVADSIANDSAFTPIRSEQVG